MSHEVATKRRSSHLRGSDVAVLAAVAMFALLPVTSLRPALGVVGAGPLIASLVRVQSIQRPAAALVGALCLYGGLAGSWFVWPLYLLIPIMLAAAVCAATGCTREFFAVGRLGRLGLGEWALIALISSTAGVCLLAWAQLLDPDLSKYRTLLPPLPLAGLVVAGVAFAVANAILEEFVWRGVLQSWLIGILGKWAAIGVQATSFGAFHYLGFPSGFAGALLAALYGILLGVLALRSGGLLAAVVAHVTADLVIFSIVAERLIE